MMNFKNLVLTVCGLVICAGCVATGALFESATLYDPPLTEIRAAYVRADTVIIDYVLVGRRIVDDKQEIQYARYWASFSCKDRKGDSGIAYDIHREALDSSRIQGWDMVMVRDLSGENGPTPNGTASESDFIRALLEVPESELPIVGYARRYDAAYPVPVVDRKRLAVVFVDPVSREKVILQGEPRSSYIPEKNVPSFLVQLPFGLLMDSILAIGMGGH
jgi:hypothetical protein